MTIFLEQKLYVCQCYNRMALQLHSVSEARSAKSERYKRLGACAIHWIQRL